MQTFDPNYSVKGRKVEDLFSVIEQPEFWDGLDKEEKKVSDSIKSKYLENRFISKGQYTRLQKVYDKAIGVL